MAETFEFETIPLVGNAMGDPLKESAMLRELAAPTPTTPVAARLPATQPQLPLTGDRSIYFFKNDHYVRYKTATEVLANRAIRETEGVDVGPAPISRFGRICIRSSTATLTRPSTGGMGRRISSRRITTFATTSRRT